MPAADGSFVVRGARVFDGQAMRDHLDVTVRDGTIVHVGRTAPSADLPAVDGTGGTLLPGLVDAHVHVGSRSALRRSLIFGVTSVVDMFMDHELAAEARRDHGRIDEAYLVSAGTLVTAPGGHGTQQFVGDIPTLETPHDATAFVRARLEEGSDFIKVVYDDFEELGTPMPTLDSATLAAVVHAAHEAGAKVVVHALAASRAREAVRVGVDILAHLPIDQELTPDDARELAERGVTVIATLTLLANLTRSPHKRVADDDRLQPYLTRRDIVDLRRPPPATAATISLQDAARSVRLLREAGVAILAGTDAPTVSSAHGVSIHGELELLVAAGFSPEEALRAATSEPCRVFDLVDRGIVRAGAVADLVLVDGDLAADVTTTRATREVWRSGIRVDRERYRQDVRRDEDTTLASATRGIDPGPVTDFADGLHTTIGSGWTPLTDSLVGGTSTAFLATDGDGTRSWMQIHGQLTDVIPAPWAGALLQPGPSPMAPVDLSELAGLSFLVQGDRREGLVAVFCSSSGLRSVVLRFTVEAEWQRQSFSFTRFPGVDGRDVTGVLVAALGPPAGQFELRVAEVALRAAF